MHVVRPPYGLGARLRNTRIPDLALGDELSKRTPGLFDRHVRIDAVLVVKVDMVDAQPAKRLVATLLDVSGVASGADRAVGPYDPELAGQYDLVPPVGDRAADELLV